MMNQLKKPTKKANCPHKKQFDDLCTEIRNKLRLHWEYEYIFSEDTSSDTLYAQFRSLVEGRRICIAVYPPFWELSAERQTITLIHEHVHAIMQLQDQFIWKMIDWSHESDRRWMESSYTKSNEHVVDHLTFVLYELWKK